MTRVEELLLGMDDGGEEHGLGEEIGFENNLGQKYDEEGEEEVLVAKEEHLDVKLPRGPVDYDYDVEVKE
jgi:hypothetical protein